MFFVVILRSTTGGRGGAAQRFHFYLHLQTVHMNTWDNIPHLYKDSVLNMAANHNIITNNPQFYFEMTESVFSMCQVWFTFIFKMLISGRSALPASCSVVV